MFLLVKLKMIQWIQRNSSFQNMLNRFMSLMFGFHLQEIFPVYFGPKYDAALEMLVWEFISRLDELMPIPDFNQVLCYFSWSIEDIINHLY